MSLKQTIRQDLKIALKQKNKDEVSTLRLLLNEIINQEKKARTQTGEEIELNDEQIKLLAFSSLKKNKEAIEEFKKGRREDLVKKTEQENKILKNYLPEQLGQEDIKKVVDEAIALIKAESIKDIGKVMAEIMPKIKGRADGSLVNKIIRERLYD
jgi:uncharacterized protein